MSFPPNLSRFGVTRWAAAVFALVTPLAAHPLNFNSTVTYGSAAPSGAPASISNWTGAAYDAANIGGSGVNSNGGANNGAANDASTYVVSNQPRQGQSFTTGSNPNGYQLSSVTARMAGYSSNNASGSNQVYWDLNAKNGPVIVEIGKVTGGTAFATVSKQNFIMGGTGTPGTGSSANGAGTYITFHLPYTVYLQPNTTYGFDLTIGNGSSNYFEWLGLSTSFAADPYTSGTAYNRSGTALTPLAGDRVFQLDLTALASPAPAFAHPGALHTQADLDRMAAKVTANEEPWKSSYETLAASPWAQTGWPAYDVDYIVRGSSGNNYTRSQQDAQAIYELALRWKLTGDTAYADHAVQIANVWSGLLGLQGDTNRSLAAGICGYLFATGGELLSTYPGWPVAEKQAYKDMMMRVFYPENLDFLWRHHDTPFTKGGNTHYRLNWDTANMASMAAIGILCDNRAVYQQAVDFFKFGPGNSRVERAAWYTFPGGLAQTEESGRDQAHNLGGWYQMALLCQMAWNQGDDLFGYDNNRVLRAFEYNAKYNLGNDVPWTFHRNASLTYTEGLWGAARGLAQYYQSELVHNHYANIKGIATPWSKLVVAATRPEPRPDPGIHPSQVDWLGLGSLTFARDPIAAGTAPSGLVANWSKDRVVLNWWGTATATGYEIRRATNLAGPYTTLGTVTGPDLNFTDASVDNATTYYYLVTANTPTGDLDSAPLRVARELATHFTFEGNADDVVGTRDAAPKGNTAPGYTTGFGGGQAMAFDGATQYAQLPVGSGNYQDITLATWVFWSGGGNWQRIFDFGSEIEKNMFLTPSTGGNLRFSITTSRGTDGTGVLNGPILATNQWVHVAVTLNGDTGTLYVNGKPVDTQVIDQVDPLFGQPFCYLGRSMYNSDPYFNGRIDDFRIYNHALSGNEVYSLWGQSANNPPTFTSDPIVLADAPENSNYSLAGQSLASQATDANGGTLTYSKLTGPSWLTVASNGALAGTPANADVGNNLFVVRVTDPAGATDDANLHITVTNTNDPPVWSVNPISRADVTRDQPYINQTLAGLASDVDAGDTLTFSKVNGPAWLTVAADGALSGTPGAGDVGANSFTVRVTDSASAFADATLNIAVLGHVLRSHYELEDNTNDSIGAFHGTATGSPAYGAGRIGRGIVLDGADDSVSIPGNPVECQDITIAAWVRWNGGGSFQRVFDFGNNTNQYLFLSPNTGSGLRFAIKNGGGEQQLNSAAALPTTQWTHVAVTLSGDTGTLYVNGSSVATNPGMTINPGDFKPVNNLIGRSQFTADPLFNGMIDDFRIYNHALTAGQVSALVAIPPAAPLNVVATPKSGKIDLSWNASQGATGYTVKRSLTSGSGYTTIASGLTGTSYSDSTVTDGVTYYYVISATNAQGESPDSTEVSAVPSDLLVWLKFNETSGTSAADSAGNGMNATLVNSPGWTSGLFNGGINLPATSSQHLTLPSGVVAGITDFTISGWVNVASFSTWQRIFDFGTGTTNYMFLATQYTGTAPNNAKFRFAICTPAVTEQQLTSTIQVSANSWVHYAVTLSGTTGRLYINGALAATNTGMTLKPSSLGSTTQNYLGRSQFPDPYLNARLDDFRIHTRALSTGEIASAAAPQPAAPATLSATPGDGVVHLDWNVANFTSSYNVKRATTSGGPFTTIATGLTGTSHSDTTASNGTTYFYVVTGSNTQGESANSPEAHATPYQSPFRPYVADSGTRILFQFNEAPGGSVTANAGSLGKNAYSVNLATAVSNPPVVTTVIGGTTGHAGFGNAASFSTTGHVIGWDAGNNGAFNADVSGASLSADAVAMSTLNLGSGGQSPWTLEAMVSSSLATLNATQQIISTDSSAASRGFQFRLSSAGELQLNFINGTSGGTADIKTAVPTSGPHAYAANTWFHVAASYDGSNVRLYWTKVDPSLTAANLLSTTAVGVGTGVGSISGPLCVGNENRNVAGELFQGKIDEVRISSVARGAEDFYWIPAPAAPSDLTATGGNGQVSLFWSASPHAAGYHVRRATASGGPYTLIATTSLPGYSDSSVANGTMYWYVVSAINSVGGSPDSNQASATPLTAIQAWRQANFGTIANSGDAADDADSDHDGRSNKLEYATGADPTVPDAGSVAALGQTPDGTRLTLTFNRIADPALTYEVVASGSLVTWETIWSSTGVENVEGVVEVTDSVPIPDHPARFLRLKVSP
ncbi:fibronectin type 3 domain-containing protein [Haloferula luteola]|uniref:Fibronectin type 3 domain-containing protein n=1 Tax=Haloferula luteola TaxID=595692 RepID=A0A840VLF5_9BACT|nr:LamG-like jellyroll fold domain-containing protein [Haloferula luteola]MBB5353461.1 fibronectin type 3 domain-containing protein [Haloferula luteola]